MVLLIKIDPDWLPEKYDGDQLARILHAHARDWFDSSATITDAYLASIDDGDEAEQVSMVTGASDPDSIRKLAMEWNDAIDSTFSAALSKMVAASTTNAAGQNRYLGAPSTLVYEMKKAAMALDNDFYDFADQALMVSKNGYMTCLLTDEEREDVIAHPKSYASIEVYPK